MCYLVKSCFTKLLLDGSIFIPMPQLVSITKFMINIKQFSPDFVNKLILKMLNARFYMGLKDSIKFTIAECLQALSFEFF